jgi:hypothetical protein
VITEVRAEQEIELVVLVHGWLSVVPLIRAARATRDAAQQEPTQVMADGGAHRHPCFGIATPSSVTGFTPC